MVMEGATRKRAFLREEDVLLLFNKYSITTILNLLKEVAHHASSPKMDWDALVKDTCTGISSAREYQMLWRHIAYQTPLLEKLESGSEPLDDDSDLEFELETFPSVSREGLAEAAASVKVLISSGSVHEHVPNRSTAEGTLSTNVSNGQVSSVNRTIAGSSMEAIDSSGGAGGPAKKKRKLWTKEEDLELIAAVDKCGEGNWANILKGDFKHDRTASQLSQRWSIIRKKRANLNTGSGPSQPGSASTEAHMAATWQAVNMAIKMPITGSLAARRPGTTGTPQHTDPPSSSATPSSAPVAEPTTAISSSTEVPQSHPPQQLYSQKVNPLTKPRVNPKVPAVPGKLSGGPTSIIQAAAIAAGGRIAPPSTAASHFKAAQSKNAVHIRPCGSILSKSTGSTNPLTSAARGSKSTGSKQLTQSGAPGLSGQPSTDDGFPLDIDSDEKMKVEDGMDVVMVKRESEGEVDGLGNCHGVDFPRTEESTVESLNSESDGLKAADANKGKSAVSSPGRKENETGKSTSEENKDMVVDSGDGSMVAELKRESEPEKTKIQFSNMVGNLDSPTPEDP